MKALLGLLALSQLAFIKLADSVPSNVQSFMDQITSGQCNGGQAISETHYSKDSGSKSFFYCQDDTTGVLYLHGQGDYLAHMDIYCDGLQDGGNGRCNGDNQDITSFQDQVQEYSSLTNYVDDLNPNYIPYFVLGNECDGGDSKCPRDYSAFHTEKFGVQPLSVMAVVCNGQLLFGVWGDTNGDDGPPFIGEASLSLATQCFGDSMNDNNGHSQDDVLYIAFPGSVSETVIHHANYAATSYDDFVGSFKYVADQLISKLS